MLPGVKSGNLSNRDNEHAAAGPFVEHHELQLAKFGLKIGNGGYRVLGLHKKKELCNVELGGLKYTGGIDAGSVPHSVVLNSAGVMS